MFEEITDDILKSEVTTRGNHLKNNSGIAIVTGLRKDKDRSGPKAVLDLMILKVEPKPDQDSNAPGQIVSKQYRFKDGSADKQAAVLSNFKRDLCELAGVDPRTMTGDQFKAITGAAATGAFTGIMLRFEPYDAVTKKGEGRTYHNLIKLRGQNAAADVLKRAGQLGKGAGPESFI